MQLSVTALLDWFRDGTAVSEVIKATDEFVPQFYDVSDKSGQSGGINLPLTQSTAIHPIAAKIASAEWATRFNKFGKRYRIGISSFGPSAVVMAGRVQVYGDLTPLAIGSNPAFALSAERTPARETILKYRANRKSIIFYATFEPGDLIEFVMPTPEAVSDATNNAKQMGGYCVGVVFFRWPAPDHEIALRPAEVLNAIGAYKSDLATPRVTAKDGGCAAVECVDLHLFNVEAQANIRLRNRITSSVPLEYFLPEADIPVRPSGPTELEVVVPPFAGTDHLFLGRAVTSTRSEFSVKKGN